MTFQKGQKKTGGRPPGTQNVLTTEIKDMVRQVLDGAGGVPYLIKQAHINPVAFMGLIGKIIPKDLTLKMVENPRVFVFPDNVTFDYVKQMADERPN